MVLRIIVVGVSNGGIESNRSGGGIASNGSIESNDILRVRVVRKVLRV